MGFDWKSLIKTVAPTVASIFGTPAAGVGVKFLLDGLLPPDQVPQGQDAQEVKMAELMQGATPELLLKIKERDQQFLVSMKDLDLKAFAQEVDDRKSARQRMVDMAKAGKSDLTPPLMALLVCSSFGYAEYWVFANASQIKSITVDMAILVGRILGTVDSAFMLVLSFYFGGMFKNGEGDRKAFRSTDPKTSGGK